MSLFLVFVGYNVVLSYRSNWESDNSIDIMEGARCEYTHWMPEKREGQELIRLYLPTELKDRFKLYCQLKGITMTEVIKEQISKLLESEDFTSLLEERLKDR